MRAAYAALAVLLVAYFVSLIVRAPDQSVPLVDGWGVAAFEVVASALCLVRALGSRRRTIPLMLGLGILSWSIGDTVLAAESAGGATPPVPSLADLFWLGFYPIVYVALVLLTRKHLNRMGTDNVARRCRGRPGRRGVVRLLRLQHGPALRRRQRRRRSRPTSPIRSATCCC